MIPILITLLLSFFIIFYLLRIKGYLGLYIELDLNKKAYFFWYKNLIVEKLYLADDFTLGKLEERINNKIISANKNIQAIKNLKKLKTNGKHSNQN
jgi:hypothetical protein